MLILSISLQAQCWPELVEVLNLVPYKVLCDILPGDSKLLCWIRISIVQDVAVDEGKDEESDGGFGNESDNNEDMEGNDDGDFDDDEGEEYEKDDLSSMNE